MIEAEYKTDESKPNVYLKPQLYRAKFGSELSTDGICLSDKHTPSSNVSKHMAKGFTGAQRLLEINIVCDPTPFIEQMSKTEHRGPYSS